MSSQPRVEPEQMRALRDAYGDVATHVLELFEKTAADTIGDLRTAMETGNGEETRRLAHRLNGSARNVGAVGMADIAAEVEAAPDEPRAAFARLEAAFGPTCTALRDALVA